MNIRCYEHDVPVTDLVSAGVLKAADEHVTKKGKTYFFNGHESLECDMINVLRAKPELFQNDIVRGNDFWHVYNSIPKSENEDINNMKFKAVVGNPPYMLKQKATSDTPIYHLFMDASFKLSNFVTLITPARFLFDAGKTPSEFNKRVLNDEHFKVVRYESDSNVIFNNVDIKGGVAITMRNTAKNYGTIKTYTAYKELGSILHKVTDRNDFKNIIDIIHLQNKFNLDALYEEHPDYRNIIGSNGREKRLTTSIFNQLDIFTELNTTADDVRIIGLIDNIRIYRYIPKRFLDNHANLLKWKVILPKSNGSGAIGEVLSTPLIGEPLIGYTQSFISIGSFDNKEEAQATLKYVKSKFMRTMLGILKVTQDNNTDVWEYVPLQDFTPQSDIDWSQSIANIDKQLYRKYKLDEDEIEFIEKMIKPMD